MTIGERLFDLRKEKGLSQEQAAEVLGVTRQTVSKWETDQSTPDFDKILPICELYGISTDKLLKGSVQDSQNTFDSTSVFDDNSTNDDYINRYNKYKTRFAILTSIAVCLYIVSVIPFFIFESSKIMLTIFFIIIGIATMMIVFGAMSKPKGLKKSELIDAKIDTKEQKLYKQITAALSGVILITYLLISFITHAWHITWILWIIYAVICQIIKLIFTLKGVDINEEE